MFKLTTLLEMDRSLFISLPTPHTILSSGARSFGVVMVSFEKHQVIAHDTELTQSLAKMGIQTPFILFHKSGITRELMDFVQTSINS